MSDPQTEGNQAYSLPVPYPIDPSPRRAASLFPSRPYHFFSRDSLVVFLGTALRLAGRLVAFLLVSNWLGRELFGLFGAAIDTAEIAESFSDLGMEATSVTFASRRVRENDQAGAARVFHTALWVKAVVATGIMLAGWALAAPLASGLGHPALAPALRLAFLLVPTKQFYKLGANVFQARQQFGRLSGYIILPPLLIVLGVVGFRAMDAFTLEVAVTLYAATQGVAFLAGLAWYPRDMWSPRPPAGDDVGGMLRFGRWVYASHFLANLRLRVNTYLLLAFATPEALGDYQYAVRLASMLNLVAETASVTLLPKMTARVGPVEVRGYTRRTLLRLAVILTPLAGLALLFRPVLARLQPAFVSAAPAAAALYLSILASIGSIPLWSALYALRRPQTETYLEMAMLALVVGLGAILINVLPDAALGAGLALLLQRIVSFAALLVALRRALKKGRTMEEGGM